MYYERPSSERGHANFGWLDTHHTFSFGHYHDPAHMGFSALRVINDDTVAPGAGFGEHGHEDMEIVTVVLSGALVHRDSLGNGSEIHPGDVQRMSAGSGVRHSEFNASDRNAVNFLQIWLLPEVTGIEPGYEQKHFDLAANPGQWVEVASRDGTGGGVLLHQDAAIYRWVTEVGVQCLRELDAERRYWLHVFEGQVSVNGERVLTAGDGLGLTGVDALELETTGAGGVLLFDLP